MDWTTILQAVFLAAMLVFLAPKAYQMIKHSPEGDTNQWLSALIPLGAVMGFVLLLIFLV